MDTNRQTDFASLGLSGGPELMITLYVKKIVCFLARQNPTFYNEVRVVTECIRTICIDNARI
jgi:hypothetical protein